MPLPRPLLYAFDAARAVSLRFYAAPLDEAVRVDPSNPKWIQLCTAGRYVYRGQPVEITGETFDRMIDNFRAHPAFNAGARAMLGKPLDEAAKLGAAITGGVVALNFDHPPHGAPRPGHGWFLDVERRGDQLWGLCWFDAEAHAGMLAGTWKWTSIEWSSETTNNRGEKIGPYLSGVALTNDPFITGMTPIQMARPASPGPVVWFGPVADVVCELRGIFALPETADVGAVIGEVAKLRLWALGEQAPPLGVDVGGIVARVRALLNLPTLADPASIFRELDKLLGLAADEQEKETMPDPTKPAAESGNLGLARHFAAKLSALLRTPIADDEASVIRAFDAASGRYDEAMAQVEALSKTFQTNDPKVIAEKIAALMALAEQMSSILGEVAAEHQAEEQAEGQMAAEDVQQVMSAQRLDPQRNRGAVEAYTAHRMGFAPKVVLPTIEQVRADPRLFTKALVDFRKAREARRGARKAFFAAHGIDAIVPVPAHLQHLYGQQLFAGNGAVFGVGNVGAPPPAGAQGQGQAPQHFAQPYHGAPLQGAPPPTPHGWSWARVSQLPPAQLAGDNHTQRVFEEVVRAEFNGQATGPRYDQAWTRANAILADITRREGPAPASLYTRA